MKRTGLRLWFLMIGLVILFNPGLRADPELRRETAARRQAAMEKMDGRGLLILLSAEPRVHSRDIYYEFRQQNDLLYLTGLNRPGIILVLMPQNRSRREILFLPERDPGRELWTGRQLEPEEATALTGIQEVWSVSEFEAFLDSILAGQPYRLPTEGSEPEYQDFFTDLKRKQATVYLLLEGHVGWSGLSNRESQLAERIRGRSASVKVVDSSVILSRLRLIKSPYEIRQLQRAVHVTVAAHLEALKTIRPGMWEYEIEAGIEYIFRKNNCLPAFPSIVASGPNTGTLHYEASSRQTLAGDLMVVDIGAEHQSYAADVTRTVPASGRFSADQTALYRVVLRAQKAALGAIRPGGTLAEVNQRAIEVLREGLYTLGLTTEREGQQYRAYCLHGASHWLGMDAHDVGPISTPLQPGMALAVEPGLYVRADALERLARLGADARTIEAVRPAWRRYLSMGVRIEDDVVLTPEGIRILSQEIPREIAEIEAAMRRPSSR